MSRPADASRRFAFDYHPAEIRCGDGTAADLGELLAARGLDDALVVAGETVGATPAVVDPVRAGLGDRFAGLFAETTPEKRLGTALAAARRVRAEGHDALVGLGGGSSLDVATVATVLLSHEDPGAAVESGRVTVADGGEPTPVVAVPTTPAGADLSPVAGITLTLEPGSDRDDPPTGSASDRRPMPAALVADTALVATTPRSVLCASAMNGFDKAVESPYSPHATPITDATALRALSLTRSGFGALSADDPDPDDRYDAVAGVVLAQYGVTTGEVSRLSIVHAFGHGFSHGYDVHQGVAHGVLAPHVLEYLFGEVDGRRALLAEGLGVEGATDEELAAGVVEAVAEVAADLGLPDRLRDLSGVERSDLPPIAAAIHADGTLAAAPVDPDREAILGVLEAAW